MCGRVTQLRAERFGHLIAHWLYPEFFTPRHNLRPTEPAAIVARRADGEIKTIEARWWCQREGSKSFETKFPMFNARVDTMYDRRLWADLLKRGQRCIFPIDSFYEWPVKGRPPVEIFVKGREPFALAGLWSRYFEDGKARYSFTTFTTAANDFMKPLHEKAMPVILADMNEQRAWLETGEDALLRPYEGELESEQLPEKLEELFPEENRKY